MNNQLTVDLKFFLFFFYLFTYISDWVEKKWDKWAGKLQSAWPVGVNPGLNLRLDDPFLLLLMI